MLSGPCSFILQVQKTVAWCLGRQKRWGRWGTLSLCSPGLAQGSELPIVGWSPDHKKKTLTLMHNLWAPIGFQNTNTLTANRDLIKVAPHSEEDSVQETHASRHAGLGWVLVCFALVYFVLVFNFLPCICIICLSLFLSLCSAFSNPLVNRSKEKHLMASYLLSIPKMLCQAGKHCCWYHSWGTPVMPTCFSAVYDPQDQGPASAPGVPCTHPKGRQMGTVVSKWFGNQ